MKLLKSVLALAFVFSAVSSANNIDSVAGINPQSDFGTVITNIPAGSGIITGISCKVTTSLTTGAAWGLQVNVDGVGYTWLSGIFYNLGSTWPAAMPTVGTGATAGDYAFMSLNIPFTTSVQVRSLSFVPVVGGGALTCAVHRT